MTMERKIKFRGKDAFTGKWVYGDLVHNQKVTENGLEPRVMVGGYEVNPETVGQFTGLNDKDGKDIYEGDVIESSYGVGIPARHFIGYDPREASFIANLIGEYPNSGSIRQGWIDKFCKKVIGNIYDNFELLEI